MENYPVNKRKISLTKKIVLVGLILLAVFGSSLPWSSVKAQPVVPNVAPLLSAQAAAAGIPVADIGLRLQTVTQSFWEQLWNTIKDLTEALWASVFKDALRRMVRNIAVDTATYLATGDKGQAPMFQTNFLDYINKEADAYIADALDNQLKQMWGVSLCEPPDPLFKVRLEITAKEYFHPPRPQCTFTKMWKNIRDPRKLLLGDLPKLADMFNPGSNELGMTLQVISSLESNRLKREEMTKLQLLLEDGFKSVRSVVTDTIKTPAAVIKQFSQIPLEAALTEKSTFTGQLAADFIGPFFNTLFAKLMKQYKEGLVDDSGSASRGIGGGYGPSFGGLSPVQAARQRFAALGEAEYSYGGKFDVLAWLACDNPASQYSCVIDDGFRAAISEEPHLTVSQAIEKNLLHGDWPVGYRPADKSGGIADARSSIYSYRSLIILRKYRIIPVGWELAAEYYQKFDRSNQPLTLNRLISDYDNPASPYYRLVDPSWVLKVPQVICEREGPGELTEDETVTMVVDINQDGQISDDEREELVIRKDYCADERSCIKESANGVQCEYYGYCTKEKPIWRIASATGQCEPFFNTCRGYVTRDNQNVGYLYNTLWGKDTCGADGAGCREYCTVWDSVTSEWACDATSGQRIFLNKLASECPADELGCSEFINLESAFFTSDITVAEAVTQLSGMSGDQFASVVDYDFSPRVNLKKAPADLNCQAYGVEIGGTESNCSGVWRADIGACVQGGSYACNDYALYCSPADAGCNSYTPVSYSGPSVPGVVGPGDMCPAECVGFQTYMEQPSFLEPVVPGGRNPLYFIADTANSCSAAHNGCEEFTDLSKGPQAESKVYFSQIRSCVLPGGSTGGTVATYYTWASTEESGNQLRSWELLQSNLGEYPCTNVSVASDGTVSCADGGVNPPLVCTFGNPDPNFNPVYNPDCLEFIAQSGSSYWMQFSRVVMSNNDCVEMRRTIGQGIYLISPSLSQSCPASAVGCREYKGSAANNISTILNADFESGSTQGWQGGAISNESLVANGHSLFAAGTASLDMSGLLNNGRSYKITFWAKGGQISRVGFAGTSGNAYFSNSSIGLNAEWGYYTLNLINLPGDFEQLIIAGTNYYIDNIMLTETQNDLYLIRDTWVTPNSCTPDMVGCEEYRDENGQSWYLKSFSRLCRDETMGCQAMIDTKNTDEPGVMTFNDTINADPRDDVTVPADELVYLVYDTNKTCNAVGCTALGLIEPSRTGEMLFSSKYLQIDPHDFGGYNSPLCTVEQLWCEEYKPTGGGAPVYFKNPNVFTCEYKDVSGIYGWYQTGSDARCPSVIGVEGYGYCLGGRSSVDSEIESNQCIASSDCIDYASLGSGGACTNWVGVCPVGQNNCTEFQDPSSPVGCNKLSVNGEVYTDSNNNIVRPCDYYYYLSDKVEYCSQVDPNEGCRAFHETGGGANVLYSTPRCTGDPSVQCQSDSDCIYHSRGNLGSCVYQTGRLESQVPPPSTL